MEEKVMRERVIGGFLFFNEGWEEEVEEREGGFRDEEQSRGARLASNRASSRTTTGHQAEHQAE